VSIWPEYKAPALQKEINEMAANEWQRRNYEPIVKSPSRPIGEYYPVINTRRVKGYAYIPYVTGSREWREAANSWLAYIAGSRRRLHGLK
jgi:hypothetical protein